MWSEVLWDGDGDGVEEGRKVNGDHGRRNSVNKKIQYFLIPEKKSEESRVLIESYKTYVNIPNNCVVRSLN